MRTIDRGRHHRVASRGGVVVTAALVAIAAGGCSSGSSNSASSRAPSTTTGISKLRAPARRDRSKCDHRHRPVPLVGRRHRDRHCERIAATRQGERPRHHVRRAQSGRRRGHRRHRHRVRPCKHSAGRGREQRCRHGAARLQRRRRAATPAHRPRQRRRARGRRPLPPTAGTTTGSQRHDRGTRCVHEPGRTPHLTQWATRWSPRRSSGW